MRLEQLSREEAVALADALEVETGLAHFFDRADDGWFVREIA